MGLLALQAGAGDVYPMDVLGAETEGMIGYLIEVARWDGGPTTIAVSTVPPHGDAFRAIAVPLTFGLSLVLELRLSYNFV